MDFWGTLCWHVDVACEMASAGNPTELKMQNFAISLQHTQAKTGGNDSPISLWQLRDEVVGLIAAGEFAVHDRFETGACRGESIANWKDRGGVGGVWGGGGGWVWCGAGAKSAAPELAR